MEKIVQLSRVFETMPIAAQIFVGLVLVGFAGASIYSRINLDFGAKTFSGIPREQLRTNKAHIACYTGIPVLLALSFLLLLVVHHTAGS